MELPPYHKPHWKSLFGSVFNKLGSVLKRALSIIIIISKFFGLPWQLFVAFVVSAMGKEAAIGVMGSLFNTGSIWAAIIF